MSYLLTRMETNCVNSRVNNFSIIIWVIKEIFVHSDWSRISSYVAMFAPHRVITVVSSGANCEAKLCAVEEKLTPKPCIEVSYFWIKDFKVRFDCFDCFYGCKSPLLLHFHLKR